MYYNFSQIPLYKENPTLFKMFAASVAMFILAVLLFERNTCAITKFIYNSGRLLYAKPDLVCRLIGI